MDRKQIRIALRTGLVAVAIALTIPLWLPTLIWKYALRSDAAFLFCTELLSMAPGKTGIFLRRGYYALTLDRFAWDCQICFGTTFSHSRVEIERDVVIGRNCTIGCAILKRGTAIGSNVDILSGRRQHVVSDPDLPVQFQPGSFTQVEIGPNAWIGNSSVVMDDIGEGAVIGAGSVVVWRIAAYVTAVGNPAVVKKRLQPPLAA